MSAYNKVVYSGRTLIDLSSDTVTADKILKGYTAHKADGTVITGTLFNGYPSEYEYVEGFNDASNGNILDSSGNVVSGRTLYKRV